MITISFTTIAIIALSLGLIGTTVAGIIRSQIISDLANDVARLEMKVDYLNRTIDNYKRKEVIDMMKFDK